MVLMYILIGYYLSTFHILHLVVYSLFMLFTILFQSYACIYWECPHVGTFCPGVGGFCVLSSPLAKLLVRLKVRRTKKMYSIICTLAFITFSGIILYPIYFIARLHILFLLLYVVVLILYFIGMMVLICPYCGSREACPGGQTSTKIIQKFGIPLVEKDKID